MNAGIIPNIEKCVTMRILAGLSVLCLIATNPAHAAGPSFDCAKPQNPSERIVCSSPSLSDAELSLVQSYYSLRQQAGEPGWPDLKKEILEFQRNTLLKCGVPASGPLPADTAQTATCLEEAYRLRRVTWLTRLSGEAAEEARRPADQNVALQRDLQQLGLLPAGRIDGVFGAATRAAVVAWQQSRGSSDNGFLGDVDAVALESQVAKGGAAVASTAGLGDRVADDRVAESQAYAAQNGDTDALAKLSANATAGDPSAQYGLGLYMYMQRGDAEFEDYLLSSYTAKHNPELSGTLRRFEDANKQAAKNGSSSASQALRRRELYRNAISLWQTAARSDDPAAKARLGRAYWNEVKWSIAMVRYVSKASSFPDPLDYPLSLKMQGLSEELVAWKWACNQALQLLHSSDQQDWPEAAFGLATIAQYTPPLEPLLAETKCGIADVEFRVHMTERSANLGSADGVFEFIRVYRETRDPANEAAWQSRLEQLDHDGNVRAREILADEDELLNATSK